MVQYLCQESGHDSSKLQPIRVLNMLERGQKIQLIIDKNKFKIRQENDLAMMTFASRYLNLRNNMCFFPDFPLLLPSDKQQWACERNKISCNVGQYQNKIQNYFEKKEIR